MKREIGIVAAVFFLALSAGCSQQGTRDTLTYLERGRARGHLNLTTDAKLGGTFTGPGLFFGPQQASVAFDGDINFGDHVGDETVLSDEHVATSQPSQ